jgi:hypothetical protein
MQFGRGCYILLMEMTQRLTRGIKHWGLGGYLSFLPRIKFGVTGQESSPQSPTISYRQPLCAIQSEYVMQMK